MSRTVRLAAAVLVVLLVVAVGGIALHLAAFLLSIVFFLAFVAALTWVVGTVWRETQRR